MPRISFLEKKIQMHSWPRLYYSGSRNGQSVVNSVLQLLTVLLACYSGVRHCPNLQCYTTAWSCNDHETQEVTTESCLIFRPWVWNFFPFCLSVMEWDALNMCMPILSMFSMHSMMLRFPGGLIPICCGVLKSYSEVPWLKILVKDDCFLVRMWI